MPAQFPRRFDGHPLSIEFEFSGALVCEEVNRKLEITDGRELRQLLTNAVDACAPWVTAERIDHRAACCVFIVDVVAGGAKEFIEPCTRERRQVCPGLVIESFFVGMYGGSHDAVDAFGRWRLKRSSPALKFEGTGKLLSIAAFDDGIVA